MRLSFITALSLVASVSAQQVVYDNGPFQTAATGGGAAGTSPISVLQTLAPVSGTIFGFGAQQVAATRHAIDNFTVNSAMIIDEIEVFGYATGVLAPSCTGVYLHIWDGNPATGTPNQLITGAGTYPATPTNLIGSAVNTLTGVFRVLDTGVLTTQTTRPVQSVRVTIPQLVLTAGTYYFGYSYDGLNFCPPISATNVVNTGDGAQWNNVTLAYVPILSGIGTQGTPFRFYGPAGPIAAGSITNIGGGCSAAGMTVVGAPTVGGFFRAELSNVNPLALGLIIVGGSSPGVPFIVLGSACGCTLNASLDVFNAGVSNFELQVPLTAGLAGLNLHVQGGQLGLAPGVVACNILGGLEIDLTDAHTVALNFN